MLYFGNNQAQKVEVMWRFTLITQVVCALLIGHSCIPVKKDNPDVYTTFQYSLQDSTIQSILEEGEQGQLSALAPYLRDKNPAYRYAAALCLASNQQHPFSDSLVPLLTDASMEVAAMAAYALGQSADKNQENALIQSFRQPDSLVNVYGLNMRILEAVGKIGSASTLKNLATASTYQPQDTLLLEGQARGIYQYMLQGTVIPEGTAKMVAMVSNTAIPAQVRLIAASYLARAKDLDLTADGAELLSAYQNEAVMPVKLALALAVGKSKNEAALTVMGQDATTAADYRLRCNLLRGLTHYPYAAIKPILINALKDANPHVVQVATTLIGEKVDEADLNNLAQLTKGNYSPLVRANIIGAYLKAAGYGYAIGRNARSGDLRNLYLQQSDPYLKGLMIRNFAFDDGQTVFLAAEAQKATDPILRTEIYRTLVNSLQDKKVRQPAELAKAIIPTLSKGLQLVDPSIISLVCDAMLDQSHPLSSQWQDVQIFQELLDNSSPETDPALYDQLAAVVAKVNNQPKPAPSPKSYVPINWSKINGLENKVVEIRTNKGNIEIKLLPHLAPATVSRFVQLIEQNFYTGLIFHRVVPNFVIQTGCPRGDGYGSAPGLVRSELAPGSYNQEGVVGMASSGRHTESSQFFITHSPALHLDGNYTIFGQVTNGMETVHAILAGDRIESVTIR